jgi:hypothetical protein
MFSSFALGRVLVVIFLFTACFGSHPPSCSCSSSKDAD